MLLCLFETNKQTNKSKQTSKQKSSNDIWMSHCVRKRLWYIMDNYVWGNTEIIVFSLSLSLSVCLSLFLSLCLSLCVSLCLSVSLYLSLSVSLSLSLSLSVSVCLSLSLSLSLSSSLLHSPTLSALHKQSGKPIPWRRSAQVCTLNDFAPFVFFSLLFFDYDDFLSIALPPSARWACSIMESCAIQVDIIIIIDNQDNDVTWMKEEVTCVFKPVIYRM